mmetsp:Transcript_10393/g.42270  ORF Transcript_10393/g.42270 Transcript_10393/m.42270 type:complete len:361 (+) Transcript_10393:851-1933(+)
MFAHGDRGRRHLRRPTPLASGHENGSRQLQLLLAAHTEAVRGPLGRKRRHGPWRQRGDAVEVGRLILATNGAELRHRRVHVDLVQALDAGTELGLRVRVAAVVLQSLVPGVAAHGRECKAHCAERNRRGPVEDEVVLQEAQLAEEVRHDRHLVLQDGILQLERRRLQQARQELHLRRDRQVELQYVQHMRLHRNDGAARVGVLRDEDELVDGGRVDVLELGGNEERSNAQQLQLAALERLDGQHAVDDYARQEEALDREGVLGDHLHEPVHEDGPHRVADVGLHVAHVVLVERFLLAEEVAEDVLAVGGALGWVRAPGVDVDEAPSPAPADLGGSRAVEPLLRLLAAARLLRLNFTDRGG